jgi:hypothetical protein
MRGAISWVFLALSACALLAPASAAAQSAEERRAAGRAYNRGSTAYLAENWSEAARWFETAHRLAPAAPALIQAVRAHRLADHHLRAATLSIRLLALYPDDESATSTAEEVLGDEAQRFLRVDVVCDGCTVELDGTLLEHPSFFVTPDEPHTITATFETGPVSERIHGEAGQRRELTFDAPPPAGSGEIAPLQTPDEGTEGPQPVETSPPEDDESDGGLSPIFFISAAVLTAGAGGLLVWSGLDALAGVDDYEADPTPARLAEGQNKELRTNILIGITAGLGVVTTALLFFTDWGGDEEEESVDVSFAPLDGGGAAILGGRF